jgi:hypothetical protein
MEAHWKSVMGAPSGPVTWTRSPGQYLCGAADDFDDQPETLPVRRGFNDIKRPRQDRIDGGRKTQHDKLPGQGLAADPRLFNNKIEVSVRSFFNRADNPRFGRGVGSQSILSFLVSGRFRQLPVRSDMQLTREPVAKCSPSIPVRVLRAW